MFLLYECLVEAIEGWIIDIIDRNLHRNLRRGISVLLISVCFLFSSIPGLVSVISSPILLFYYSVFAFKSVGYYFNYINNIVEFYFIFLVSIFFIYTLILSYYYKLKNFTYFFIKINLYLLIFCFFLNYYNLYILDLVYNIYNILIFDYDINSNLRIENVFKNITLKFLINNISNLQLKYSYLSVFTDNLYISLIYIKCFIFFFGIILLLFIYIYNINNNYNYEKKIFRYEFIFLYLLSIFGILLLLISNDLLMIYLSLEIQSFCFYILTCIRKEREFSNESGLKYFILGSFTSCLFLYGTSYLYGVIGSINLVDIFNFSIITLNNNIIFGFFLISIALFFKLGVAPFHFLLPDIYEGIFMIVVAFFSTIPKIGIVFLYVKLYFFVFFYFIDLSFFFLFLGISSLIVGTFGGLYQLNIKRLIAYSSIMNIGFIILSFMFKRIENIHNIIIYIMVYSILIIGFFIVLILLNNNRYFGINNIYDLKNLYDVNPLLAFILAFILFSLLGLPPLAGFFIKFFILNNLINNSYIFLVLFIILLTVITSFYYLRLIKIIFFEKKNNFNYFIFPENFKIIYILLLLINIFNIFFIYFLNLFIINININLFFNELYLLYNNSLYFRYSLLIIENYLIHF